VRDVLARLFAEASAEEASPPALPAGISATHGSPRDRSDAMAETYMPISSRGGNLLYTLVRACVPQTVIEFGTSFGISTIYLAAAVADNGTGHVFGTELSARKADAARRNLAQAGVAERATILDGDARETLRGVPGPVGVLFLDGWKDLCLPVLKQLESRLAPGALVIADDIDQNAMMDYLAYVRNPAHRYVSVAFPVDDGMEISCLSIART
jgi:predicted O-methyltransferase YrrM